MLNTKNRKGALIYTVATLLVLTTIILFSGCIEKNPMDDIIQDKTREISHGEIDSDDGGMEELEKTVEDQKSGEPDEQIDATDVVIDAEPTPKGTVDEYCSKSLEGYQLCFNLNSDGTCTFIRTKIPQDVEVVLDGKWDEEQLEDETYVITEIEGDKEVFLKLDNGNLFSTRRGIFISPKATPLKSAVGIYTTKTEHYVIEFELKADGTFEERMIFSPEYTEKCSGVWNEEEDQTLTVVIIGEGEYGGRSTSKYLRLDNTKLVDDRKEHLLRKV